MKENASTRLVNRCCSPGLQKVLIRLGCTTADRVAQIRAGSSDRKILSALALAGDFNEDEILSKLALDLGLERAELKSAKVIETIRHAGLAGQIEASFLAEHRCVPVKFAEGLVTVALADPLDMETISRLEYQFGSKVRVMIAREEDILQVVIRLQGIQQAESLDFDSTALPAANKREADLDGLTEGASDEVGSSAAPVVKFVNQILHDAFSLNASDVHLEPAADKLEVRYRIDGVMTPQLSVPKRLQSYVTTRLKILGGMDITEKRRPQDGRFRMRTPTGAAIDIRSSTVPTQFGEKVVMRLLHSDLTDLSISSLGFTGETERRLRETLQATDRIMLVCGPTGSGKTTTLYSLLTEMRQGKTNIITVEDPVEIRLEGVTQIQVDQKVGMTFASGLKSILRQDPDVILVGEIRDLETAEIAFQAAQTGHFVLSTLHTNTAQSAVVRLMDLGLEPFIIASSLGGILAQRLLRKVCNECARPLTGDERDAAQRRFGISADLMRRGLGCEKCEQTGYRGRVAAYSLLTVNAAIRDLVRIRASEEKIRQVGKAYGMRDLLEAALELAGRGITTVEEVERVIGLGDLHEVRVDDISPTTSTRTTNAAIPESPAKAAAPESVERGSIKDLAQKYHEAAAPQTSERKKILLVDDDEGVRAVVSRILRKADFDVCEASNGYEALDRVLSFSPDIIVTDLVMPGLSGKELVSELKRDQRSSRIPVLMLTGSDNEENEIELIELGANDFVSKTSSPALVVTRIKRLLNP
ncbi:MAG: ATPase, T2SS/T4P/T4SS family [Bdellovibrionota bacterium]